MPEQVKACFILGANQEADEIPAGCGSRRSGPETVLSSNPSGEKRLEDINPCVRVVVLRSLERIVRQGLLGWIKRVRLAVGVGAALARYREGLCRVLCDG